ncbi:CRISPR system Cascade subunit CasC [Microbulbifer rhizosphaerae]|uniref:CRISPR system Cascade subunit CasC n=2 Tax=Microbulbifer rhizosphaerae TaxID=1562603 RepID=A0A7W4ZC01_9GAMM|nr:CRISPR system Cascade subunit CasC [Microbulbifer rhizosphaerae]
MQEFGIKLGIRTKKAEEIFVKACREAGANEEQAAVCGTKIAAQLIDDTLLFVSETEAAAFAAYAAERGFDDSKIKDKELAKVAKKALNPAEDALDIALFGRMVAKAAEMNVEAAASFSHAISTHKVSNEVEFFTALDDRQDEPGSAHMGSLEFNSATYYRYISLDLGQLAQTMGEFDLKKAIEAFTKALFVAVPNARQTTQSGASPWEFARVMVRKGQRLQVPFETSVKACEGGYLQPSIENLKNYLEKKEKLAGSLFGKLAAYDWGEDEDFSIDALVESLQSHVQ